MQSRISFFIINIFLLSFSEIFFAKVVTSDLLDLLQDPAAKSTIDQASKVKTTLTVAPKITTDMLLANVETEQNDINYQDALKILSNKIMRAAYHDDLVSIQLFLLDYISQILQKYCVQTKKEQKSISLTDLLQKIVPELPSDTKEQLSNLTDLLQKESQVTVSGGKPQVNLEQLLQKSAGVVPVISKPKANLDQLLKAAPDHVKKQVVQQTKKPDKLLNLLTAG